MDIKYIITLFINDRECEAERVSNDAELFAFIGISAISYFLALEAIDYKDAFRRSCANTDARLLEFTCTKETDQIDAPHRHGLRQGLFATGNACINGHTYRARIEIKEAK